MYCSLSDSCLSDCQERFDFVLCMFTEQCTYTAEYSCSASSLAVQYTSLNPGPSLGWSLSTACETKSSSLLYLSLVFLCSSNRVLLRVWDKCTRVLFTPPVEWSRQVVFNERKHSFYRGASEPFIRKSALF